MKTKALSLLISFVLITAIIIVAISVVLAVGLPAIERAKDAALISEAKNIMQSIDSAARQVLFEGNGAQRVFSVSSTGGDYFVEKSTDTVKFKLNSISGVIDPGTRKTEGNLLIIAGADVKASEYDADSDGTSELVLENSRILFAVRKIGNSSSYAAVNNSQLVKLIQLKENSLNITPADSSTIIDNSLLSVNGTGYTQLAQTGDLLREASIKAYIESGSGANYEIWYTLRSNADFVLEEVRNIVYR
ncbi:MAG: hypothetical protein KKB25_03600 [Nanoarchaeota archaeon]|nr:hypothetical protein [Nanoarchaeota archaeon]